MREEATAVPAEVHGKAGKFREWTTLVSQPVSRVWAMVLRDKDRMLLPLGGHPGRRARQLSLGCWVGILRARPVLPLESPFQPIHWDLPALGLLEK